MLLAPALLACVPAARVVHVTWEAPPGCGSAALVEQRIAEIADPGEQPLAPVSVAGDVERDDASGYRLTLRTQVAGRVDHRVVEAPDCATLVEGAALIASLAAAPAIVSPPADESPSPPPARPAPSPVDEPALESNATDPPKTIGITVELGAQAGVSFATQGPVPTVGGSVALRWRALRVALGATHWLARETSDVDNGIAVESTTRTTAGSLDVCGVPTAGRVEFPVCGGLLAGAAALTAKSDASGRQVFRDPWVATSISTGITVPVHPRVALGLAGIGIVSLLRPKRATEDFGAQRPGSLGLRLGLEIRLP